MSDECELTVQTSKIPTYERMWNFMDHNPEVFVNSTKEGLEKVLQGNYSFLLESTMNEYVTQRNCDLIQVGGLLDAKGYGIGMPRGSSLLFCYYRRCYCSGSVSHSCRICSCCAV